MIPVRIICFQLIFSSLTPIVPRQDRPSNNKTYSLVMIGAENIPVVR